MVKSVINLLKTGTGVNREAPYFTLSTITGKNRDLSRLFMRLLKFIPLLFFAACSGHSTPAVPETGTENTELLVLTTDLLSDTAAIRAYEQYHSKESAWPELLEANKRAGIEKVAIYRWGTRLVLMMEVPRGINGKTMDSLYRGDDPKVAEWGNIMSGFQVSPLGEDHPQKWVPMQKIHGYENGQFQ